MNVPSDDDELTRTVLHKDLAFPEEAIEEAILREETPLNVSSGNSAI